MIVVAPHDALFEKTVSNMQEVAARGGKIIADLRCAGVASAPVSARRRDHRARPADPFVAPLVYAVPVQLLAYHTAVLKGTDVDQPRNLAKSVTVE